MMQITSVSFLKSASKITDFPERGKPEIALIGRSNVGKSSLINFLTNQPIAKTSDKPGKTQLINFFFVNKKRFLVDLPGYGYAKASLKDRVNWIDTIQEYFLQRKPKILILIDGSIPPQPIDLDFIEEVADEGLDFSLVITKIDKASQKDLAKHLKALETEIKKKI